MIKNSGLIGIVVAVAVVFLVTGSVIPMALTQGGNTTHWWWRLTKEVRGSKC